MDGREEPFIGFRASSAGKHGSFKQEDPYDTWVTGYADYLRFKTGSQSTSFPQKAWMNDNDVEKLHNLFEYVQENIHEQGLIWSSVYMTGRLSWLFRNSQLKIYEKGIETLDGWGVFTFFRKW